MIVLCKTFLNMLMKMVHNDIKMHYFYPDNIKDRLQCHAITVPMLSKILGKTLVGR